MSAVTRPGFFSRVGPGAARRFLAGAPTPRRLRSFAWGRVRCRLPATLAHAGSSGVGFAWLTVCAIAGAVRRFIAATFVAFAHADRCAAAQCGRRRASGAGGPARDALRHISWEQEAWRRNETYKFSGQRGPGIVVVRRSSSRPTSGAAISQRRRLWESPLSGNRLKPWAVRH